MFLIVPSDDQTKWKAKISPDNLTIEWPKGPDGTWSDPPWNDLFMEKYREEFMEARRDFERAEVDRRKLSK